VVHRLFLWQRSYRKKRFLRRGKLLGKSGTGVSPVFSVPRADGRDAHPTLWQPPEAPQKLDPAGSGWPECGTGETRLRQGLVGQAAYATLGSQLPTLARPWIERAALPVIGR